MPTVKKLDDNTYELDLKGYVCPYPPMYTSQALNRLPRGSTLKIMLDNPPSIENIKNVAQRAGAKVREVNTREGFWEIVIEL